MCFPVTRFSKNNSPSKETSLDELLIWDAVPFKETVKDFVMVSAFLTLPKYSPLSYLSNNFWSRFSID